MAVEVVVPGQIPGQNKMGGKCQWCGCVVKCLEDDAKFEADRLGGSWYEVPCPTIGCGRRITVSPKVSTDDDLYVR